MGSNRRVGESKWFIGTLQNRFSQQGALPERQDARSFPRTSSHNRGVNLRAMPPATGGPIPVRGRAGKGPAGSATSIGRW